VLRFQYDPATGFVCGGTSGGPGRVTPHRKGLTHGVTWFYTIRQKHDSENTESWRAGWPWRRTRTVDDRCRLVTEAPVCGEPVLDGSTQVTRKPRKREQMRPTQNTVIHGLLGVTVLLAIVLLYLVLAHHGQPVLPPSRWILFGGVALALVLAAFLPSLVRRWRGLPPPQPLSPADIRLVIMVTLAGCALAFFGVFFDVWWLMAFGIMLPPLSFIWRNTPKQQRDRGNAGRDLQGARRL
jgi:hypothetical protein